MIVIPSRRAQKAIRKFNRGGTKDILKTFSEVVDLLANGDRESRFKLQQKYKDHPLKGNMHGNRELHLGQDVLLIYREQENELIELRDIVSHEELRRM